MSLLLLLLLACTSPSAPVVDRDGDGWIAPLDCDDTHPRVNPGAEERWYDGVDQDCSGGSDFDQDGDGDPRLGSGGTDCDDSDPTVDGLDHDGDGVSACDADCDDRDPAVAPGAPVVCGDGVDNDCDGASDCAFGERVDLFEAAAATLDAVDTEIAFGLVVGDFTGDGHGDVIGGGGYVGAVMFPGPHPRSITRRGGAPEAVSLTRERIKDKV